jgi:hypothetical protein
MGAKENPLSNQRVVYSRWVLGADLVRVYFWGAFLWTDSSALS